MAVSDLLKYAILVSDAASVIGGALYIMLEGKNIGREDVKNTKRFLDVQALQSVIEAAFEPTELAFARVRSKKRMTIAKREEEKARREARFTGQDGSGNKDSSGV